MSTRALISETLGPTAGRVATESRPRRGLLALSFACLWVGGMALTRLLFEWRFPEWAALGRPGPVLALSVALAIGGVLAGRRLLPRPAVVLALLPLLFNVFYLAGSSVDLVRGRVIFFGSLWLVAALLSWALNPRGWRPIGALLLIVALLPVYLLTMSHAVGAADTFEFQVVAPQLGIAHPTGYPLYLLLGKLATLIPVDTTAWRLNLASALYALGAVIVVYWFASGLLRRPPAALVGALALGLAPVFWSQAIVAEVYTLHALIVATALWLMMRLLRPGAAAAELTRTLAWLAFVVGLGLTNHLTTVFLLPPAALATAFAFLPRPETRRLLPRALVVAAAAFLLPLLLYAYLPLRWAALNGEPMGLGRFVEWVAGGRFQGALQWMAWLRDPARWSIIGRLFLDAWGWFYLALAGLGLIYLFLRQRRVAAVLSVAAAGFAFYALNYYVPDLSVFLIAAHVVIGIWVAAGAAALVDLVARFAERLGRRPDEVFISGLVLLACAAPAIQRAPQSWKMLDQSASDGGEPWGRAVLALPLEQGAAVLADSEKIAPLYYLQQVEGLRPDLDIMVLPDEAAYRAELDARLAAGQAVYLARYLPGLAGVYHLRSVGPLVQVSPRPLEQLPADAIITDAAVGPLRLIGYAVEPEQSSGNAAAAASLTLYWQRPGEAQSPPPVVYLRWRTPDGPLPPVVATGRHPAGDAYPINAWRGDEIVPDYHLLPHPVGACSPERSCPLTIEVAVAPRFSPQESLAWTAVTAIEVPPAVGPLGEPVRVLADGFALDGVIFPAQARQGVALPFAYSAVGDPSGLQWLLVPPHAMTSLVYPMDERPTEAVVGASAVRAAETAAAASEEPHVLLAIAPPGESMVCGWLAEPTNACVVAEVAISGAALPPDAANFGDRMALLSIDVDGTPAPGGQLPVTLTWMGLSAMSEDYTVTVQVLDAADRIVGQVDAWPVQGTYPTSEWTTGQTVTDPYVIQLGPDVPPGEYRLMVGVYLLATLQRLPVLDAAGAPIDDRVTITLGP